MWGLADTVRDAQLCATELVTNVMRHVGVGTPTRLAVSMSGSRLRLEVGDPEIRVLPTPGPVAEALLGLVGLASRTERAPQGPLSVAQAEEAAIDVIADLLHWLRAHGCDPDSALDRAQMHFEAELPEAV